MNPEADERKPSQPCSSFRVDALGDRFEAAWLAGEQPRIEDFVGGEPGAADSPGQRRILLELVMIDLEHRWRLTTPRSGKPSSDSPDETLDDARLTPHVTPPRLEDYARRFPAIGGVERLPGEVIAFEYQVRCLWATQPKHDEYIRRFPARRRELLAHLAEIDQRVGKNDETVRRPSLESDTDCPCQPVALRIRCPHCRNPVDVVEDKPLSQVSCPACGSSFGVVGDEALVHETQGGTQRRRQRVAHFELLEQIGFGAFGTVWRARDTQLDRIVAVKIPRRGQLSAEETEKFVREARAVARLRHPNIVSVHEVGLDHDLIYIVSDFIDGLSLGDRLSAESLSFGEAAELCETIAQALHYAHDQGVIHRDLKPSNIMIASSGAPHLMDFGLAKREAGEITVTMEGDIIGTPAYMSPEQAKGEGHAADRRSDVYSLGVVLFELLTGQRPFGGNFRMLLRQVVENDPPSPRRLNRQIPRDLETITLKAIAKEPSRRYQNTAEMAADLRRWLDGRPITARPISRMERLWRWCRRDPIVAGLSTAVVILFALLAIVLLARPNTTSDEGIAETDNLDTSAAEAAPRNGADNGQPTITPQQGEGWALLIGVGKLGTDDGHWEPWALNDVPRLAETLRTWCGYDQDHVLEMTHESPPSLRPFQGNILSEVPRWLATVGSQDSVMIYFSGFGFRTVDQDDYLLPVDYDGDDPAATAISVQWLREQLAQSSVKEKLLVLDADFPEREKADVKKAVATRGDLAQTSEDASRLVTMTSSKRNQISLLWEKSQQSLFNFWFNEGIRGHADADANGAIDVDELYAYVCHHVTRSAEFRMPRFVSRGAEFQMSRSQNPSRILPTSLVNTPVAIYLVPQDVRAVLADMARVFAMVLEEQQLVKVGIVEFANETDLDELLGVDSTLLARYCAEELERRLMSSDDASICVVDRRTMQTALRKEQLSSSDIALAGSLKALSESAGGISAIAMGTFCNRVGSHMHIRCRLLGTDTNETIASAGGMVPLEEPKWYEPWPPQSQQSLWSPKPQESLWPSITHPVIAEGTLK